MHSIAQTQRSWHSCLRQVNAGSKNTPSMHHPWRQNVTSSMGGLKKYAKISAKMVNPRMQKKKNLSAKWGQHCLTVENQGLTTWAMAPCQSCDIWGLELFLSMYIILFGYPPLCLEKQGNSSFLLLYFMCMFSDYVTTIHHVCVEIFPHVCTELWHGAVTWSLGGLVSDTGITYLFH